MILFFPYRGVPRFYEKVTNHLFLVRLRWIWRAFQERWDLPKLLPRDLRHWVATTCRRDGLSEQSTAYLMGHDPSAGGAMRDWYDNPQLEDMFAEQTQRRPNGPQGFLTPPRVEVVEDIDPEVLEVVRGYMNGHMGTMEFSRRVEVVKQGSYRPLIGTDGTVQWNSNTIQQPFYILSMIIGPEPIECGDNGY